MNAIPKNNADLASIHLPSDQATTVSRRVDKFAELMQSVWLIRNDYERRVRLVYLPSIPLLCFILITSLFSY